MREAYNDASCSWIRNSSSLTGRKLGVRDAKVVTPQQGMPSRSFDLDMSLEVIRLVVYQSADEITILIEHDHDILWKRGFVSRVRCHWNQVAACRLHAGD